MDYIKKLAIFLKLFDAYDEYISNTTRTEYIKDEQLYISAAFTWGITKQGYDFWSKLDKKWRLFLENKTILEVEDIIKLFDIRYKISKGASGYYLYNDRGENAEIFEKLELNVKDYDVGLGGIFPYRETLEELQELTIELEEKAIDKTGMDYTFIRIFRPHCEHFEEIKQPETEEYNQKSTEKDCLITEPIITIKKHKKQTFVL